MSEIDKIDIAAPCIARNPYALANLGGELFGVAYVSGMPWCVEWSSVWPFGRWQSICCKISNFEDDHRALQLLEKALQLRAQVRTANP